MKVLVMVLFFLMFYSCRINNNGFKIENEYDDNNIMVIDSLRLISKVTYSGYFVDVTYDECKEISLFYPDENGSKVSKPDYRNIIKQLKLNNPSNWDFYYCPTGLENTLGINRIKDTMNVDRRIDFIYTDLDDYLNDSVNIEFKHKKIGKYSIAWDFYRNIKFWKAECPTSSLNKYLTRRRSFISTSNKKYYACKLPYYYFINEGKVTTLLPESILW